MKIRMEIFKHKKWIDVTDKACLFERHGMTDFFEIISEGYPFRFDCDELTFCKLLDWIRADYSCLDDCDYYNFGIEVKSLNFDDDLILYNGSIMTFDKCLDRIKEYYNYLIAIENEM